MDHSICRSLILHIYYANYLYFFPRVSSYCSQSTKGPSEFAEEVVKEAHLYNGFNLILADFPSESMVYVTNRPNRESAYISEVSSGIHVLSNASLDYPWPKV